MHWVTTTLMTWDFRRGYFYQPWNEVEWMTWCGGGPLDNEVAR